MNISASFMITETQCLTYSPAKSSVSSWLFYFSLQWLVYHRWRGATEQLRVQLLDIAEPSLNSVQIHGQCVITVTARGGWQKFHAAGLTQRQWMDRQMYWDEHCHQKLRKLRSSCNTLSKSLANPVLLAVNAAHVLLSHLWCRWEGPCVDRCNPLGRCENGVLEGRRPNR